MKSQHYLFNKCYQILRFFFLSFIWKTFMWGELAINFPPTIACLKFEQIFKDLILRSRTKSKEDNGQTLTAHLPSSSRYRCLLNFIQTSRATGLSLLVSSNFNKFFFLLQRLKLYLQRRIFVFFNFTCHITKVKIITVN